MRRASETSVIDTRQEEQRERRRAREARAKDGKPRDPAAKKSKKPNPQMDLIDKLDVTSIYGTGSKIREREYSAQYTDLDSVSPRWSI